MEQGFVILPRGVHAWGPENHDLGAIPEDVVERRSKGYLVHQFDTPQGWSQVDGNRVVVVGDLPEQAMKLVASTGDEIVDMLTREFETIKQTSRYLVRIFDKRADFCSYAWECGVGSLALSMYNPRKGEVALHFGEHAEIEDFEETYAHELTHAFMDRIYGVRAPLWFAEGMAEYFSNLQWTKQGYRPTGRNSNAMMHLGEELMPLRDVLAAKQDDMYVASPLYYAQSWALVRFLLKRHPEIIEDLLHKRRTYLQYLSDDYQDYVKRIRRG